MRKPKGKNKKSKTKNTKLGRYLTPERLKQGAKNGNRKQDISSESNATNVPLGPSRKSWIDCAIEVEGFLRTADFRTLNKEESWLLPLGQSDTSEISNRIGKARRRPDRVGKRIPVEVHLGIDFGTSSTKLVAGLPFEPGKPSYAIPAPTLLQSEDHPYLWRTLLWATENAGFSLEPETNAQQLRNLKTDLMMQTEHEERELAEIHVTAFLYLQILQSIGWLRNEDQDTFDVDGVSWYFNFGYPAAKLDNNMTEMSFRRCCAAALSLHADLAACNVETIKSALGDVTSDTAKKLVALGGFVVPEITAAVAGFAASHRFDEGLFAMIDVGGTTVDCCTFNLHAPDHEKKCSILEADVRNLGVLPLQLWTNANGNKTTFLGALYFELRSVIKKTRDDRNPLSPRWHSELPAFFVGGGSASVLHRRAFRDLSGEWLNQIAPECHRVRQVRLEPPANMEHPLCNEDQVSRLFVAIGLSQPEFDMLLTRLPSQIENVHRYQRSDYENAFVDKDQV